MNTMCHLAAASRVIETEGHSAGAAAGAGSQIKLQLKCNFWTLFHGLNWKVLLWSKTLRGREKFLQVEAAVVIILFVLLDGGLSPTSLCRVGSGGGGVTGSTVQSIRSRPSAVLKMNAAASRPASTQQLSAVLLNNNRTDRDWGAEFRGFRGPRCTNSHTSSSLLWRAGDQWQQGSYITSQVTR